MDSEDKSPFSDVVLIHPKSPSTWWMMDKVEVWQGGTEGLDVRHNVVRDFL